MKWVDKYKPQSIDDCILTKPLKERFIRLIDKGEFPNLLLTGEVGSGKTSIAKILANSSDYQTLFINGSREGREHGKAIPIIDDFCKSASLFGSPYKIVIIDEADGMNQNSVQDMLISIMDENSSHCSFILTCNDVDKLIPPIQSRCVELNFHIARNMRGPVKDSIYNRVVHILQSENVEFDETEIRSLVNDYFPDFRRIINYLQSIYT